MSAERSGDRSLRGNVRPHRRGRRPRRPACRTFAHVGGAIWGSPLRGNVRPHRRGRRPRRPACRTFAHVGGAIRGSLPTGQPLPSAAGVTRRCHQNAAHIRLLAFFDRCGNSGFASSATGSAKPQFPRRGRQGRPLRRGGYYPPACRTSTQVCGRFVNRPYGEMQVCIVGAGALDGPLVGHACRDGGRGKPLPYGETSVRIVGAGALDGPLVGHRRMSAERSGDRSLRGNVRPHRRGRRPRQPVCRTSAHVCGRFMNRPYGGTGNSLPHLSQATSSPAAVIANQRRNAGVAIRIL